MPDAPQIRVKKVSEARNLSVSFVGSLDAGELLTGTPTAVEITTTDLTITNVARNSVALTINDQSVAVDQAVTFQVTGGVAGTRYELRVTVTSTASPAQTIVGKLLLDVIAD